VHHKKGFGLKKDLGLFTATAAGVGIIVGAGVYVLIGSAAGIAGNGVWLSFFISSLVALFTGLSYAELSSLFPDDASEFLYTEKAFGKRLAFLVGYAVIITGIVAAAAVALGLAGYASSLLNINIVVPLAILAIALFTFVNYWSIKDSAALNVIFTILEVGGLLLIIAFALRHLGSVDYLDFQGGTKGVLSAAALIFFAFIGFESVVKLSEETKNAKKIIPKALVLSIIITTVIYILVAISAVSVLDWQALGASKAPLADVAKALLGQKAFVLLSIIALFSTGNTILISLVTTSRMVYGIAGKLKSIKFLTKIGKKRRTPVNAILLTSLLAVGFTFIKDIEMVASITNFGVFFTFIIVNAALIRLRYTLPKRKRGFKVPLSVGKLPLLPVFGIIASSGLLLSLERKALIGGILLFALGLVFFKLLEKKS